jgi:glycosyltransferase involved in cell wall biosynthesis
LHEGRRILAPPLLISLPHGLNASGVTTWAVRLVNALAGRGRVCGLVVHDEPAGQHPLTIGVDPRVELVDARGLPPLDACGGDLADYLPAYRLAIGILAARAGTPVVCSPNLLGDSYGILAELSRERPELLRVLAVHHSDLAYNDLVCAHYAELVSAFVGVSERIASRLRAAFTGRAADIHDIPYGVEIPEEVGGREPLAGRPLRLLYTGRMDQEQKRVAALLVMSDVLCARGVTHELALVGDGPAAAEVDALCAVRPCVHRFAAMGPDEVAAALDGADFFVLASRYEGLSVSVLEALARGCVPVLTPSASGTGQLVGDGRTGFLAAAGPEADAADAGEALAAAVMRAAGSGDHHLAEVRRQAHGLVRAGFSVELCADRYGALIDRVAAAPARAWPAGRAAAFTGGGGGGSGTVPANASARLAALLASLAGKRIAVYGTGRHTIELRSTFERAPVEIVAFVDDDPARCGTRLWGIPIISPDRVAGAGLTDVVLSSWLHQGTLWSRRGRWEVLGLRVHRIYSGEETPAQIAAP